MGHWVRYIGSLFRVDELVPVIHRAGNEKSKIYRQSHLFTTTGQDRGK